MGLCRELKCGKYTSHNKCKSCGHEFHGSATRVKELLFRVSVNVAACSNPPPNVSTNLHKYAVKLKAKAVSMQPDVTNLAMVKNHALKDLMVIMRMRYVHNLIYQ